MRTRQKLEWTVVSINSRVPPCDAFYIPSPSFLRRYQIDRVLKINNLVFSKWRGFRRIRWIGQNHSCMNWIHLQKYRKHFSVMVSMPDCCASDLGSIPGQVCQLLRILFCYIHLIRRDLWKNSTMSQSDCQIILGRTCREMFVKWTSGNLRELK